MTHEQALKKIRQHTVVLGGQVRLAAELNVRPEYINNILKGRRAIGPKLLKYFGWRKVISCKYTKEQT